MTPPKEAGATASAPGARPAASHLLAFAIEAMRGKVIGGVVPGDGHFAGAAFDSRAVRPGELFFALSGERVDGFDYCVAAARAGAAALVVDARRGAPAALRDPAGAALAIPVIGVPDPLAALADLARALRARFSGRVVGITGSNGKTTTRELTAAALGAFGSVLRTQGNYNTEIGLPLTIIGAPGGEDFWVLEMAMRGRGQIALLAEIARPHVGVITNVAGAHVELLGSIEEVARAKGELFAALGPGGVAIFPARDPLIEAEAAHISEKQKLRFEGSRREPTPSSAPGRAADVVDVVILETLPAGLAGQVVRYAVREVPVVARLPLGGVHNARNGAAALAVAAALGLSLPEAARALAHTVLPSHRSFPTAVAGRVILDDCYNANPASMRAAVASVVAATGGWRGFRGGRGGGAGRPFAILGDMLELGPDTVALHREVGREAGRQLAGLATVGALGAEIASGARESGLAAERAVAVETPAAAAALVAGWSRPGDWILVKASRGMLLERAIDALGEEFRNQPAMT